MAQRDYRIITYDIEDYLAWRGDVPFSADPFNEVDNLVLCEFAYTNLDGIVPADGSMQIGEIRERFFETHSCDQLRSLNTFNSRSPFLMDGMVSGSRFGNMTVGHYINEIDSDAAAQMAAMTFMLDDGTAFVCFRGTDSTLVGWKEDLNLSYMCETEGQRKALLYLINASEITDRPLRVGGHSKGGNFAVYASSFCGAELQDRLLGVYTNDGPGFRKEVRLKDGYRSLIPKITSIVPDTSIIGQLLEHDFEDIVVKSRDSGFMQHNGFSWCVDRNRFVRSDLSDAGVFVRHTQSRWLAAMDDETRESFVNTLFELFEATEFDTFHQFTIQKKASAERMLASLRRLPKEQQREMLRVFQELFRSGSGVAKELITDILNRE